MNKNVIKDAFGWGFLLWLVGYGLGIVFFTFLPTWLIGWVIMPIGLIATVWVLTKKVKAKTFGYFLALAVAWTAIAIVCDYFFLVKAFKPADGYYKLDVYLYYLFTFILPILIGRLKK